MTPAGGSIEVVPGTPAAEDYVRLRAAVGWPSPDAERCARALAATVHAVTAHDGAGHAVGMGRLIGDDVYLLLVDVVVHPQVQGHGVGARIVQELTRWAESSGAPHVALAAGPDVAAFYERSGFRRDGTAYLRLQRR